MQFLLFEKEDSHLRGISKKLKIPVSSVKREIDNLKSVGIIVNEGNKIRVNRECNFLVDLKNILIKTDGIVYPVKKILNDEKIKYGIIFGSFARGDYTPESDVDLLIVGDMSSFDLHKKIRPVENEIGREINPVVWTVENLRKQKNSGFVKDILKKGFIILKGDENEFKKIVK